ncbi:hypothetical protein BOTBODRAFT_59904 [Botryobasidium botryosum FD-172 SS1]|uniref:G domain-containing protein n=1 Tax=Botryobasidium botryosum (strain FD-172 SS1) TaxID=930990 RepID=A0A067M6V3_BOTB1|nr:hypothetical protein BOTBODRAFT_59904 [Botryobasidium botryosum FD-172 SS1]
MGEAEAVGVIDDMDLPATAGDVFEICPKFRVLVLGRAGVGKRTLMKRALGVETLQGTNSWRRVCSIGDEIVSPDNSRFVVHDSQRFEPGERKDFDIVKDFVDKRHLQTQLPEKLHAIWYCIKTPRANGGVLEAGDEKFLGKKTSLEVIRGVPIIVVFTQYDTLPGQIKYDMEEVLEDCTEGEARSIVEKTSQDIFDRSCAGPIRRINSNIRCLKVSCEPDYKSTLKELLQLTAALIRENLDNFAWLVSAAAQRSEVNNKYWRKATSKDGHFLGRTLCQCFDAIYSDIIKTWNLSDPELAPLGNALQARLLHVIQNMQSSKDRVLGQFIRQDVETIKLVLDTIPPSGPGSSRVTAAFNDWLFGYYQPKCVHVSQCPGTLSSLMGFIVELILILERLFWVMYRQGQKYVTLDLIEAAFQEYDSEKREKLHTSIREYVENSDYSRPEEAHIEFKHLIESNRVARDMEERPSAAPGVVGFIRRVYQ